MARIKGGDNSELVQILIFLGLSIVIFTVLWLVIRYVVGRVYKFDYAGTLGLDSEVTLLDKAEPATNGKLISQKSSVKTSNKLIKKSDNQSLGIEFTYSVWVYLDGYHNDGKHKFIFYKGSQIINDSTKLPIVFCPLLYLDKNSNILHVLVNTYDSPVNGVSIGQMPINKWLNITVAVNQVNMDVYINGHLSRSLKFDSLPKQNNGDIQIAPQGGFKGYISKLKYFNRYLSYDKINSIVDEGPGPVAITDLQKPRYLSNSFWSQ